jgi:hypothetical protein
MVRISSNVKRTRIHKLAALVVAGGLAMGAASMPADAAHLSAHSASHHTTIIIIGGRRP